MLFLLCRYNIILVVRSTPAQQTFNYPCLCLSVGGPGVAALHASNLRDAALAALLMLICGANDHTRAPGIAANSPTVAGDHIR